MRDSRSLLLLLVSLLLVLVSFGLLWTWGYRVYIKNEQPKTELQQPSLDSAAIANRVRDSLQHVYSATLKDLDLQLDSTLTNTDSLKSVLDIKLNEFYRLRNEITAMLNNRKSNSDFTSAKQKIGELQNKVQDFKEKNSVVENENKKLSDILTQLGKADNKTEKNINKPATQNKNTADKSNPVYSVFTASDIKFSAMNLAGENELETINADKTDKLTGSFTVLNFNSQLTNAEVMVVVLQPNGRVLKNSTWDAGSFSTPDGKKIYSYKFNFNYTKGEAKRLLFSLKAANLEKGNYTMEVYYNGLMIGRTVKTLS